MPRLNVLLVLADQHHAGLLGCAGHPQVQTPRLDAFAATGVRFGQAICQNPICTPSRVSLASGQYCHNTGYYGLGGPAPAVDSLYRHFRAAGYRTAGFGKLHYPTSPRNWIADDVDCFGDTYETPDGVHGESRFFDYLSARGLRHLEDSWHNAECYGRGTISLDARPSLLPYEHTQEVWSAREALSFIDGGDDRPFFVQVAFQKPHHPLLPQQRFWDLYSEDLPLPPTVDQDPSHRPPHFQAAWQQLRQIRGDYGAPDESWRDVARRAWRGTLACVSQADDVFGQLLDGLADRGLSEQTIVVYGSDHGCYHTIHGLPEKAPGICSDAVCRVPLLWQVPGLTRGGVCQQLVENVDYATTLTALCDLPPMAHADGCDLRDLLAGGATPVRECAVTEHPWSRAIYWDRYRLVHYPSGMFDGDVGELYDLQTDPDETHNLYHEPAAQELVQTGRRLLLDWLIRTTRLVTSHPTVMQGSFLAGRCSFPLASDGRAPREVQPRWRAGHGPNYL